MASAAQFTMEKAEHKAQRTNDAELASICADYRAAVAKDGTLCRAATYAWEQAKKRMGGLRGIADEHHRMHKTYHYYRAVESGRLS